MGIRLGEASTSHTRGREKLRILVYYYCRLCIPHIAQPRCRRQTSSSTCDTSMSRSSSVFQLLRPQLTTPSQLRSFRSLRPRISRYVESFPLRRDAHSEPLADRALEFDFRVVGDGRSAITRYANNSNYRNDSLIRKESAWCLFRLAFPFPSHGDAKLTTG